MIQHLATGSSLVLIHSLNLEGIMVSINDAKGFQSDYRWLHSLALSTTKKVENVDIVADQPDNKSHNQLHTKQSEVKQYKK